MIAVCGAGHADSALDAVAEAVGRAIAESGALLICGGRGGVMKAACRGARAAGGVTIGILPGGDTRAANPHVLVPIVTNINRYVGELSLYHLTISGVSVDLRDTCTLI